MINLEILAKRMEDQLNEAAADAPLQSLLPNTSFAFKIVLDTADYQPAERIEGTNNVIYYINGLMSLMNSEAEGINETAASYSASLSTTVDFLIPMADLRNDEGVSELVSAVRDIIGAALQSGMSEDEEDEDGNIYLVGSYYNISTTGMRDIRERVGDSMTLLLLADFYIVGAGIASSAYRLEYVYDENGEEKTEAIYYSTLGLGRKTVTQSALTASDSSEGLTGAKSTPESTMLTIGVTLPMRNTEFGKLCDAFIADGSTAPFTIRVKFATIGTAKDYKMIFDQTGLSAEINLAAMSNFSLLEYMELL
jgi:hypothetical protein